MKIQRDWATPVTIGVFALMSITGILMFFRVHRGLNGFAHEWLGWIMVVGVACHSAANWNYFKHHLGTRRGKLVIAGFVALLALSFYSPPEKDDEREPDFAAPVRALARAPLSTLAQVTGQSNEQLLATLKRLGIAADAAQFDSKSLQDLIGPKLRRQVDVLSSVTPAAPAASAPVSAASAP